MNPPLQKLPQPLLCLDTTTPTLRGGIILNDQYYPHPALVGTSHQRHSSILLPTLTTLLSAHQLIPAQLKGVALNIGPGSFTGIRTGIVTARTLGQCFDLALYPFSTFELLAYPYLMEAAQAEGTETNSVLILLDAHRGQAYEAFISTLSEETLPPRLIVLGQPTTHEPSEKINRFPSKVLVSRSITNHPDLSSYLHHRWHLSAETLLIEVDLAEIDTAAIMGQTLLQPKSRPSKPWSEIHPLYLQQPSVTLKKS